MHNEFYGHRWTPAVELLTLLYCMSCTGAPVWGMSCIVVYKLPRIMFSLYHECFESPVILWIRRRSASARPATATTVLSGTMGISDWTFIFPESDDLVCQDKELNLPTLDDFDLQIAVFEVRIHRMHYSAHAVLFHCCWNREEYLGMVFLFCFVH